MDPSQDFKALRDSVQSALVTVTRSVNGLANEDLQFQRTVHPSVARLLDQKTGRLLELANGVLNSAGKFAGQRISPLEDVDDVEIQWRSIVDVIDSLFEKADTCLDEYTGLIKRKDAPTNESGRDAKRPKSTSDRLEWSLKRANILKPQNAFEKKTDNFDSGPWKPLLTRKPHAQVPLEKSLTTFSNEAGHTQYKHPYEHEILNLQYPRQVSESCQPVKYLPIETTKAVWVDTYEGILEMLEELKKATEIAIDLEHHDFRTYSGLLSLMQISTREKDWIVDTLVPWRHKLEALNEVFADPKVVKVLHGAFMDIIWLQRDLGLYIVGLFDTYFAAEVLGYAGRSLAFLLKKFVDFDAEKKYQLADWRIRPLPDEMLYYARSDTHYLLYIYDMLRNELAELSGQNHPDGNPIDRVLQKSREESLQRYEYLLCDPETGQGARGWFNTLIKSPSLYNGEQFAVYKAVHKWRDDLARREDESPNFIMGQQVLADIARILPTDKKALWSLLDANARGLKIHLDELFDLIQEARVRGANGPTMMEFFRQSSGAAGQGPLGAKQVEISGEVDKNPLSIQELKSEHSQLWGGMALSSAWDGSVKTPASDEQVEIPLLYDQSMFSAGTAEEELPRTTETPAPRSGDEPGSDEAAVLEDQGFTLRRGRKRKADEANVEPEPDAASDSDVEIDQDAAPAALPDSASDDAEAHREARRLAKKARRAILKKARNDVREKAQREGNMTAAEVAAEVKKAVKAAKKEWRKQQKQQQGQQPQQAAGAPVDEQDEEGEQEDEQPFDYSKAESVLHAQRAANGNGGGESRVKAGKAAFDPYAKKSGDAPRGARKLNYEKAGRTATFKK
ncbi:hypothetical protein VTK56DRAFT_1405 [Thermocarpiscus australiensis]